MRGVAFTRALLHPRYWMTWLGLVLATGVAVLPQSVRHRFGAWVGDYLYHHSPKRHRFASANLKQVYPEYTQEQIETVVQEHLRWYGKALIDYSVFFFARRRRLATRVSVNGLGSLQNAMGQNKPIILLLTHSVMLEFAAVALAAEGMHSFGSYKESRNAVLDWMIARSRCRFVDFVVSRDEGLRPLLRAIQSKRIMIFLPDEDLGLENSVFAPFFGRQKATLTTAARLCKLGKATAFAGFVAFDPTAQQYQLNVQRLPSDYPSGDAAMDAQAMNQCFESLITVSPLQYMWLMRLYKTTHEGDTPLY